MLSIDNSNKLHFTQELSTANPVEKGMSLYSAHTHNLLPHSFISHRPAFPLPACFICMFHYYSHHLHHHNHQANKEWVSFCLNLFNHQRTIEILVYPCFWTVFRFAVHTWHIILCRRFPSRFGSNTIWCWWWQ